MKLNIPGTESNGPIMLLAFAADCSMLSLCSHFLSCMEETAGMRILPVNLNERNSSGNSFEHLN